jgi:hypothetical protein
MLGGWLDRILAAEDWARVSKQRAHGSRCVGAAAPPQPPTGAARLRCAVRWQAASPALGPGLRGFVGLPSASNPSALLAPRPSLPATLHDQGNKSPGHQSPPLLPPPPPPPQKKIIIKNGKQVGG